MTCPRHPYCAYTGDEEDRCWFCHTPLAAVLRCKAPCCRNSFGKHIRHHEHEEVRKAAAEARRKPR
jgi:hypothetical protein